jgi:hypothetical protein
MTRNHLLGSLSAIALVGTLAPAVHAQVFAAPYAWTTTLTTSSPTYFDPSPDLYYYDALAFIPDTTGSYTFTATNANLVAGGTWYELYNGIFNPNNLSNMITSHGSSTGLSSTTSTLISGNTYTLVTTTYNTLDTGTIDNQISGPVGATIQVAGGASAPEPGSLALLGLVALPAIGLIRRRK